VGEGYRDIETERLEGVRLKRRTWRLKLAAAWLAGTTFGILDIRHAYRNGTAEREVRRAVSSVEGHREAQRLSRMYR
jgi:hypothetical protein